LDALSIERHSANSIYFPDFFSREMSQKPIWSEGLLVSQHHFQAQDRYFEAIFRERWFALRRFSWGIWRLEVDERLIDAGQFGIRKLSAIWPDGLAVSCTGEAEGDPLPEPRAFEPYFRAEEKTLDVLVAVPAEATANVAAQDESLAGRRFGWSRRLREDYNTGGSPQEVDFAIANVRLLFGTERRDGLTTLTIAQLLRQADGKIVVRDTFVPPVLHVTAAPFLANGLRRVIGAMIARQRELLQARKQRHPGNVEFHLTDARRFWLLHTLNGGIPVLAHLLETGQAHPEEVYLELLRVASELATFAADADSWAAPRFDYLRLGDVFEPLFARVLSLVTMDSAPSYAEIALQRRADGMHFGKVTEPSLFSHEFFLGVRSSMPEADLRERVPQLLKVADWKNIVEVVKQARHGVRVDVEWHPNAVLPLKPGVCFFRLRREGSFWEEIAKTRTLALYLPNEPDWKDAAMNVYAVDPVHLR